MKFFQEFKKKLIGIDSVPTPINNRKTANTTMQYIAESSPLSEPDLQSSRPHLRQERITSYDLGNQSAINLGQTVTDNDQKKSFYQQIQKGDITTETISSISLLPSSMMGQFSSPRQDGYLSPMS